MDQLSGENDIQMQSYAEAVAPAITARNTTKPVFIKEADFFTSKPNKDQWITHVELYKTLAYFIPSETIAGLQRVRGLWRIYLDDQTARDELLMSNFSLRGKNLTIYSVNPGTAIDGANVRIRVKNVPLSADDGQIKRALEMQKCDIKSLFREKLRVDGRLTNCETGDRIVIVAELAKPLPTSLDIGRYKAVIHHKGQLRENNKTCGVCLQKGHTSRECTNEMVCKCCLQPGHVMADCPKFDEEEESADDECQSDTEHNNQSGQSITVSEDTGIPAHTEQPVSEAKNNNRSQAHQPSPSSSSRSQTQTCEKQKTAKKKTTTKGQSSGTTPTLHKFLSETPNRKSTSMTAETRSPPTPLHEKGARDRPNKKSKDSKSPS